MIFRSGGDADGMILRNGIGEKRQPQSASHAFRFTETLLRIRAGEVRALAAAVIIPSMRRYIRPHTAVPWYGKGRRCSASLLLISL